MFASLLQKFISLLLTLIAAFSLSCIKWRDGMEGHNFPIIPQEEKAAEDVRVMSFNVRCADVNGVPQILRIDPVIREILRVQPDLLGAQEATPEWMAVLQTMLPAYGCVGVSRDNGKTVARQGEAAPIFYLKEKYELVDHGDFWISDTPDEPSYGPGASCRRICTWALLKDRNTQAPVAHVNTHLDSDSNEARKLGANMICDFIADRFAKIPVVFTADLNSEEGGPAYRIMTEKLNDACKAAADSVSFFSWHDGDPGENSRETLDYVMCSRDITVNAFRTVTDGINGRLVSDHFPVYADVTFPPAADSYAGHDFPLIGPDAKTENTTRIMSFNVRCADVNGIDVPFRSELVPRQIEEVMPDSVGLQEATAEWMGILEKRLTDYAWVGLERDNGKAADKGGEACPIFWLKAKYRLLDHGDFWLSDTPDQPSVGPGAACKRICTWAKLKNRRTGAVYVHVNSHFDHVSEEARVLGGEIVNCYIEEHFAGIPVVFTADMNTKENGEAYKTMTTNLLNARHAAPDCVDYGTFHNCRPETHADSYIDFVLCSDDIDVLAYRTVTAGIDGRFVSDHFPIYADVMIPGGRKSAC
ncbi:MAG: endonuclease/exonuclease/phosphatase family protein [Clostridia bacterium]|nr:endonuclease/exonuclease/phosphatase family protein [Clostridia bacterium]